MLTTSAKMIALETVADPDTNPDDYAAAIKGLAKDLVDQAILANVLPMQGIHVVSAAADYDLVLEPALEALKEYTVAVSCLWPITEVLVQGGADATSISMALSEKGASQMPQLLVLAQTIGTVTELEAILAHVLFDMGPAQYDQIVVLSIASHTHAQRHLQGVLPENYQGRVVLIEQRKDKELSLDGVLKPGVGHPPLHRAGFTSPNETRAYVPARFREKYDFTSRPKFSRTPKPFG